MMKYKYILLLIIAFFLLPNLTVAQQEPQPSFNRLSVSLWPEYDQPETLVIYQFELDQNILLPVQLTFRLPGYLETMHAIAIVENDRMIEIGQDKFQLRHEGDNLMLTVSVAAPIFRFEYYDPEILTIQGQNRQFDFQLFSPYPIKTTVFDIQEPYQATNFSLSPKADKRSAGNDGLQYNLIEVTDLAASNSFDISASYERSTDELSVNNIVSSLPPAAQPPTQNQDIVIDTGSPPVNSSLPLSYILIGAGVVLLLGTGGYWLWVQRNEADMPPRRPSRSRKHNKNSSKQDDSPAESDSFCYNCGVALHGDANFCHSCGAERR